MSDNPAPVSPTAHAPARSSARWIWIALAVLLAGAAGAWFGDVPNRYRAGEAMKAGRVALLQSDYSGALRAFREAALLRPNDEAIIVRYEQTQAQWLEVAERKLEGRDAKAAYLAWRELAPSDALFTEPVLGKYRARGAAIETAARDTVKAELAALREQADSGDFETVYTTLKALEPYRALAPELTERRQEIETLQLTNAMTAAEAALKDQKFAEAREALKPVAALAARHDDYARLATAIGEAETRAWLRAAETAAGEGKFKEARELLDQAAAAGRLADEVTKAREAVLKSARAQASYALAIAISQHDRAKVEGVLAEAETYAGWKKVPADDLLQPANVAAFLETLKAFDLGTERQSKFADRLDIPLVLWARQNFQDQAGADDFLRDGFAHWSQFLVTHNLPATALYVNEQAQACGAKADDAWRKETRDRVAETVGVTIAVRDPLPDKDAPDKLNADATAALKAALTKKLKGWPKLVEFDEKRPATVVLQGRYDGFYSHDYPTTKEKFVRYQSGTRPVRNREEEEVYQEFTELKQRYDQVSQALADKVDYVNSVGSNPNASDWDRSQLVYKNIEIASDRNLLSSWRSQLNELRQRGQSMPKTVAEPVYDDERYFEIQHVYSCTATWVVDAELHGASAEEVASFVAGAEFKTSEVAGDASHGVPVKAPQPLPKAKLLPGLARDLVKKVAEPDEILRQLPEMTVASFANFHAAHKTDRPNQTEQFLGLVYAWERAGGTLQQKDNILQAARQNLGLPPLDTRKK